MSKISGLGMTTLSVDLSDGTTLTDILNDVHEFSLAFPRGVQDITGVDKSAIERLLLLADGTVTLNGTFNTAKSHTVFKTVPTQTGTTLRTTSLAIASQTLSMEMLYTDYQLTRAATGEFTWSAPGSLADGTAPAWS